MFCLPMIARPWLSARQVVDGRLLGWMPTHAKAPDGGLFCAARNRLLLLAALLPLWLLPVWTPAGTGPLTESVEPPRPPAQAVASAHPAATEAGLALLEAGGNAFDAAVAISAVLAVVEPYGSGLGGGGFWLLHRAADGRDWMIDGRERAPLAATRDLYLDDSGALIPKASLNGPRGIGKAEVRALAP